MLEKVLVSEEECQRVLESVKEGENMLGRVLESEEECQRVLVSVSK